MLLPQHNLNTCPYNAAAVTPLPDVVVLGASLTAMPNINIQTFVLDARPYST